MSSEHNQEIMRVYLEEVLHEPLQPMARSASGGQVYPHLVASIFDFSDGLLAEYQPFVDAVEIRNQLAN
ncbi:MAG: hypothetical protein ACR2QO_18115 [Acidimicrobiales bacterium]